VKKSLAALILSLLATALQAQQGTPPAASPAAPAVGQLPSPSATAVAADYIIGPGDSLQVFVWRNPDLSGTVPVRPDGKISTPLVEDMVAIGKTPSALARDIEKVLSAYVRQPQVNVIVSNAVSAFSQVKVVGQLKTPQALPFREGLRVLDIVLACGGLTDFAAPNRARIVRANDPNGKGIRVRLGDLLNRGDLSQNLQLRPGDVLIVPQSRF
jgi:polysaccharide export outer membrane protein